LLPQTLVIKEWLSDATNQLSRAGITSARLDTELILANVLGKPRTYLHAHGDNLIDPESQKSVNSKLSRRLKHEPIAYIIGYKDFYGRKFIVNKNTLIPRPESEDIIDLLKVVAGKLIKNTTKIKVVDIGTGSGCLGITAKLELPSASVTLSDISDKALVIADQNAKKLFANVDILKSDLLQEYQGRPNIIVANLPYVDLGWECSPETDYEPRIALFAEKHGLGTIEYLIIQASKVLLDDNFLIIEADPTQHASLIKFAKKYNFKNLQTKNYAVVLVKLRNSSTNTIE